MSKAIQIRMGGYGPAATGFSKSLKFIGDRLEQQFGDRVEVKYVWNIMDFGYRVTVFGFRRFCYNTAYQPPWPYVALGFTTDARYSSFVRSGRESVTSASVRTIAVGVRSSCDASAMNRRCCSNERSRRSSRSLMTRASLTSSSPPLTGSRSCRLVALISAA